MWFDTWKVYGNQTEGHTHLLLTGGVMKVSDASHAHFLNQYANAVARGDRPAIVERRTPIFRLFFDLDVHVDAADRDRYDALLRGCTMAICAMSREWFLTDADAATVLRKDVETPDKIGIHLVFEHVYVTSATAIAFREYAVRRLCDAVPDTPWPDIVDPAVYKGSGLRLPWATKRGSEAVYVPIARIEDDAYEPVDLGNPTAETIREWVRRTSIRAPDASATPIAADYAASMGPSTSAAATSSSPHALEHLSLAEYEDVFDELGIPVAYAPHKITSVHRVGAHAVVFRSSSKKCANKGFQEHRSSNVYFVALRRGVCYQRCYCRKDGAGETELPCAAFASPSWPLRATTVDRLFPAPAPPPLPVAPPMPSKRPIAMKLENLLERTRPPMRIKKPPRTKRT